VVRKVRAALLLAGAACAAAAAEPPLPPTAADLAGARSLALAAYRGTITGNDGTFTNAASLAAVRRYSIEVQYLLERFGATREWQSYQGSIVDSETTPVTAGLVYTRITHGPATGNVFHVPLALPLGTNLYGGVTGKYLDLTAGAARQRFATADASLYWQPSSLVGIGVAGYNLVPVGDRADAPQSMGVGLHVGDQQRFNLLGDWRGDFQRRGKLASAWSGGAEYLVGDSLPVRAGFTRDSVRGGSWWSVGLGLVTSGGWAIDLGYRQGVQSPQDRTFGAAIKLFAHPQQ
jgi:hypothetical protein